jgi:hypothetical protein
MTSKAEQLIQLAQTASFDLSDPESKLLWAVSKGEDADYKANDEALNDSARSSEWNENRTLRATLIRWLCTDSEACKFLTHSGLSVQGAKIIETLDLRDANLAIPLVFRGCVFAEAIRLERAKIKCLDLSGSHIASSQIHDISGVLVTTSLEAIAIPNDL